VDGAKAATLTRDVDADQAGHILLAVMLKAFAGGRHFIAPAIEDAASSKPGAGFPAATATMLALSTPKAAE